MADTLKRRLLFIKDIEDLVGRNRLTLRRWWEKDNFPKPSLINNRLAWKTEVIEQWLTECAQKAN